MRLRDILICIVAVVLVVILLTVGGMRLDFINSQRLEMKLISNEPLQNAPPSLAFATVAMGAFRGLVVDILWIRADRLKEQGQFFDAKQLAEWITVLQPRFAQVWAFQAWNMAYNISAAIPAEQPDQRWQWVKNGYELLRDRGIPLNPKSILLYRELGIIFQHKIGGITDDVHRYYKLQLALAMEPLLGPADNAWFEAIAKAPTDWQQMTADADVAPLIAALKAADKNFEDDARFVGNYLSLRQNPVRFDPAVFKVIDRFRGARALEYLDVFAKAWQLRNVWKLDPVLMQELNQTYGPVDFADPNKHYPLDWRHPDTHAIYWAIKGLRAAGGRVVKKPKSGQNEYSVDEENTDRIVAHSLQNLFRYGKIYLYDVKPGQDFQQSPDLAAAPQPAKEIFLRPDMRMFDPYNGAITKIVSKYSEPNDDFQDSHEVQHRNMLSNAVFAFYQAGHKQQAQRIYDYLRRLYPREEFSSPAVEYLVKQQLRKELRDITAAKANQMVATMLCEAYFRYAVRDDDEAFAREKLAEEIHDTYNREFSDEKGRLDLPDFKVMRYAALLDFFNDQQYPPVMRQNLLARIKIERPQLAEQFSRIEQQLLMESQEPQ